MRKNILVITMIIFFFPESEVAAQAWNYYNHYRRANNAVNQTRRTVDYYNQNKNQTSEKRKNNNKAFRYQNSNYTNQQTQETNKNSRENTELNTTDNKRSSWTYTTNMNLSDYLEDLFKTTGKMNLRRVYFDRRYVPGSLSYQVLKQDNTGLPVKIFCKYYETFVNNGKQLDEKSEAIIYFDKGVPCRASFPDEKSVSDISLAEYHGNKLLNLSESEFEVTKRFNADFTSKEANQFDINTQNNFVKIANWQASQYPKRSCNSCIVKSYRTESFNNPITKYDERGNPYYIDRDDYRTIVGIRNICNYPVYFIGIKRKYDKNGYYFEDYTIKVEKNYYSENLDYLDLDYDNLNPNYDPEVMGFSNVQFLKLMCDGK